MLSIVKDLISKLEYQGIAYCHWKSNLFLADALSGIGDLDILVDRKDSQKFESVLATLNFKRAREILPVNYPAIQHFYGLDIPTGQLVHLHVYYRVVTGESLLKNYCLPLENVLLHNTTNVAGVPIPAKGGELIVFVLRMMVKHAAILEYLLLKRSGENLKQELDYLFDEEAQKQYPLLLQEYLPSVDINLFNQCLDCLRQEAPFLKFFWLSIKLRQKLKLFNRLPPIAEWLLRGKLFIQRVWWRLYGSGKSKQLTSGGAVIAFVGAEATGKSTLVKDTQIWLGKVFHISSVHLGKPPSTLLTFLPNLTVPLLRGVATQDRMSTVVTDTTNPGKTVSLLYAVRSVLVAWDRWKLAIKIRRQAANGQLVICDRYPSPTVGAMDSPRLTVPPDNGGKNRFLQYLANLEHRLYNQIPPADIIVRLSVPVEVAIERNQQRQKQEPTEYVVSRHTSRIVPLYPKSQTIEISSNQTPEQTIANVRRLLWEML
ncbi:hypothetical protein H6G41_14740 [Tolypothrix sp. FACHB-123]|uniref:hypothetical protein n=1 Tax=Tolypothrix sp. FACHB-123 TaxID=2692868 RepID=UPI0016845BB7|nr:hypothetical protein [Tolypothrix sp. FACHB-123]MBD2355859.1 hypothetical protein [Tolypothrix sp. FACHB-123]